ncbi:LPS export ABC transporter periplasmic protein LptC [Microbulbifer sp. 2201CG32-9]|uniref:LPS export ABC transporter periplasmic protein LptC n=1 Tax=unclassified Microbulbifer TaxID=2619833 RepID=UPI00345B5B68
MRSWLPLFILATLIGVSLWYADSAPEQLLGKRPTQQEKNRAADLVIRDAHTRHFDTEGALAYIVNAEQITYFQFARRDQADLAEPRIVFYQDDRPKWLTESRQGIAYNNGQKVELSGDVVINELPEPGGLTLETQAITVLPQQEFAETDKLVTITSGTSITEGIGMHALLKENRVKILSEVKSTYESD